MPRDWAVNCEQGNLCPGPPAGEGPTLPKGAWASLPPTPHTGKWDFNHCNILVVIHYMAFNKWH